MLIVGSYPDGVMPGTDSLDLPLRSLHRLLAELWPKGAAVHLLPVHPHSGDGGFAIDDWNVVRPELGSWEDVDRLASDWHVLVDGVYNHVGMGHRWVKRFFESPTDAVDILHAYKVADHSLGPASPRGQAVLRPYDVKGERWHLWQTFSAAAVDIRLDNKEVLREIDAHLDLLKTHGIRGIRLDAVAYYAKSLGSAIRHNPGVHGMASDIARRATARGLQVSAQVDCDRDGLKYFNSADEREYIVSDFSYCAYLTLSLISGDPRPLVKHLNRASSIPRILLRSPRTHDGILLRSGLIDDDDSRQLISTAEALGLRCRREAGRPYELNCSAPFLYHLVAPGLMYDLIEFAVVVTGIASAWPYFYLPFLAGWMPELQANNNYDDPRALNRLPAPSVFIDEYMSSPHRHRLAHLLNVLHGVSNRVDLAHAHSKQKASVLHDDVFSLTTLDAQYLLIANMSHRSPTLAPAAPEGPPIYSKGIVGRSIAPLGYAIWHTDESSF